MLMGMVIISWLAEHKETDKMRRAAEKNSTKAEKTSSRQSKQKKYMRTFRDRRGSRRRALMGTILLLLVIVNTCNRRR